MRQIILLVAGALLTMSAAAADLASAVLVSVPDGKSRSLRVYTRLQLPQQVSKLYAIAGAYIDTTDPNAKSPTQPPTAPATGSASR